MQVWKLGDGAEIKTLPFEEGGNSGTVKFIPERKWLVASSVSGFVKIWNVSDWSVVKVIPVDIASSNFYINREGSKMLVGTFSGSEDPLLFDLSKMEKVFSLKGHTAEVNALSISPDGSRLVTGSYDQTIRFWDAATGKCVYTLRNIPGIVYCISFLKNSNKIIYSQTEGQIRVIGF